MNLTNHAALDAKSTNFVLKRQSSTDESKLGLIIGPLGSVCNKDLF